MALSKYELSDIRVPPLGLTKPHDEIIAEIATMFLKGIYQHSWTWRQIITLHQKYDWELPASEKIKELIQRFIHQCEQEGALGCPIALNNLAFASQFGLGCDENHVKAIAYYKKAIALDYPVAMANLAFMLQKGQGIKQNYAKAIELLKKAIAMNCPEAMLNMAIMHKEGLGGEKDYDASIDLLNRARKMGSANAMVELAGQLEEGLGGEKNVDEISRIQDEAFALGHLIAINNQAMSYRNKKDYAKAIELLDILCSIGDPNPMINRAVMYFRGEGSARSKDECIVLLQKAIKLGSSNAMYSLYSVYQNTPELRRDYRSMAKILDEAIIFKHPDAMLSRATMLYYGYGCARNYIRANQLLDQGVLLEHSGCMSSRAVTYQHGKGCVKDDVQAARLYRRSLELRKKGKRNLQGIPKPVYQYHYFMLKEDWGKVANLFIEAPKTFYEFLNFDIERFLKNPKIHFKHIDEIISILVTQNKSTELMAVLFCIKQGEKKQDTISSSLITDLKIRLSSHVQTEPGLSAYKASFLLNMPTLDTAHSPAVSSSSYNAFLS